MPNNTINSVSPTFRDFLLNRNLISDTVKDNGLSSLLHGIGQPAELENGTNSVLASSSIESDGSLYKDLNVSQNQYVGSIDDYQQIDITTNPRTNSTFGLPTSVIPGIYQPNENNDLLKKSNNAGFRKDVTTKNLYLDAEQQSVINVDMIPTLNTQTGSYLDENNNLNVGGPSTQLVDIIGTVLRGQGLGIGQNGVVNNFDIRTTLAGRVLGATGVINDTRLGMIGGQQLAFALANNAAFHLQQETIGHINKNPLSLLMGNNIIVPNYTITVPIGTLGKALDYTARILGFEIPVSLMADGSSIFTSENPINNIERANNMIENTGKGQVLALFANINANKYKPAFSDERVQRGFNRAANGTNPLLYAFNGNVPGTVKSVLANSPILDDSEFNEEFGNLTDIQTTSNDGDGSVSKFTWGDEKFNKDAKNFIQGYNTLFTNPNSLLARTKKVFDTNKMKTIVSGHGVRDIKNEVQSSVVRGFVSKGSAVLSSAGLNGATSDPSVLFCRTWTTFDKYNQVLDLQKHRGLYGQEMSYRDGAQNSVLDDNGFVKITPYRGDASNVKNYMFSIENLAWAGEASSNLLESEKGPGDSNGIKGRIMWFPPYDLNVTENNSSNLETTNFIGRGEPVYTYNNTERTGTLSFKVIVDHPSYLNALTTEENEYITSFFAGCTDMDPLISSRLTTTEIQDITLQNINVPQKKQVQVQETPDDFNIYFSNDSYTLDEVYENGLVKNTINLIDYNNNPTGAGDGEGITYGDGVTNILGTAFPDNTNFGFNNVPAGGGWITQTFKDNLSQHLKEKCPACRINIDGFASTQGSIENNQILSNNRADAVKDWFLENIIAINDPLRDKRFGKTGGLGQTGEGCTGTGQQDREACKVNRRVQITFTYDPALDTELQKIQPEPVLNNTTATVNQKIVNRFYDEANYFEKLRQEDTFVFDKIRNQIKYFHPAFHSTTPEGLNSRLTFLLQCTRQGPTISSKQNVDNLAFGKSPVCILRLGDFYHSKIIIDNIGISYEPLVWDLNPEGIGVQPMIANVDLSFKFIGGQSLQGPINKLQNAVSFNFFANTHVYDQRSEKLKKEGDNFIIVEGQKVTPPVVEIVNENDISGLGSRNIVVDSNQEDIANNQTTQEQSQSNEPMLTGFNIGTITSDDNSWFIKIQIVGRNIADTADRTSLVNKGIKIEIINTTFTTGFGQILTLEEFNAYFDTNITNIGDGGLNSKLISKSTLPDGNYSIGLNVGGQRIQSKNITLTSD